VTLRLGVDTAVWNAHLAEVTAATPGLIPVIKGNGYGFGRSTLLRFAAEMSDVIAVGTIHELAEPVIDSGRALVLTPTLQLTDEVIASNPILTVAAPQHLDALDGWGGRVSVKLASPMARYGATPDLITEAHNRGLQVVSVSVHPPLPHSGADRLGAITDWLDQIPHDLEVWVSHLEPEEYRQLPSTHRFRLRMGTGLWHGDKSMVQLRADIIDQRPINAGTPVGYRQHRAPADGTILMIGCGTAHGVRQLAEGSSPFHWARHRLGLLEPPHMHTSMVLLTNDLLNSGIEVPTIGDLVDVQHPLTFVAPDIIDWN
jgi:alanine racemase